MAFGFGFNKAKVLASAEKNAKQGKLHNAIADYEKIAKEDPKDLNVLNTIGDLYARVGNVEQASVYFQRVGEAYAGEGFTVKAIAMYKKLTKQNPNAIEVLTKLAELYTQQGLYNDARAQYNLIADQYLRQGEKDRAVNVFQKILELDPDNAPMQTRLAELYVKLGRQAEARDIYFRSAQSLRARGALDACDDALGHVLKLDPGFAQAVLLRGQVRLEANDAEGAVRCLESLPDLDSRAEALRGLLRARLKLEQPQEAEPLARKLLNVFNDSSGIMALAEWLTAAGQFERALQLYREHSERLLRTDAQAMLPPLHALVGRVKSDPRSLETLCEMFQKAGDAPHVAEVSELLAHAYVQENALEKARDLYLKLAELEPENPLHGQSYKQIVAKLGGDSAARQFAPEEGAQALLSDELDQPVPAVEQRYPADLTAALKEALTDAELFASYNLPARAIPPLEAVLPRAPSDVQVNQQLASLYARCSRFADAAQRCAVLQSVFAQAGHEKEANRYAEMGARYQQRAPTASPAADAVRASVSAPPPAPPATVATEAAATPEFQVAAPPALVPPAAPASFVPPPAPATLPGVAPAVPSARATDAVAHEIDLSEEWDRVLVAQQAAAPDEAGAAETPTELFAASAPADAASLGDLLEEVNFYLAQSMWEEARAAFARAEAVAPNAPAVDELRARMAEAPSAAAADSVIDVGAQPAHTPPSSIVSAELELPEPVAGLPLDATATVSPPAQPWPAVADLVVPEAERDRETAALPSPSAPVAAPWEPAVLETEAVQPSALQIAPPAPVEAELELAPEPAPAEMPLPDETTSAPQMWGTEPAPAEPASSPQVQGAKGDDLLEGFVLDLEQSLEGEFSPGAPSPPVSSPAATQRRIVAEAAATPVAAAGDMEITAEAVAEAPISPLDDLFAEFKRDVETGASDDDDPETHYNLGVAFKEMGLLDEAIGELQKVCKAIEHGQAFPQMIEAYTWLADCFLKKGVPEAGIHWYEKALHAPGLGDEQALAVHYELACARQAAGDLASARQHFMHVLSVDIDYRDVAERIKALKS